MSNFKVISSLCQGVILSVFQGYIQDTKLTPEMWNGWKSFVSKFNVFSTKSRSQGHRLDRVTFFQLVLRLEWFTNGGEGFVRRRFPSFSFPTFFSLRTSLHSSSTSSPVFLFFYFHESIKVNVVIGVNWINHK